MEYTKEEQRELLANVFELATEINTNFSKTDVFVGMDTKALTVEIFLNGVLDDYADAEFEYHYRGRLRDDMVLDEIVHVLQRTKDDFEQRAYMKEEEYLEILAEYAEKEKELQEFRLILEKSGRSIPLALDNLGIEVQMGVEGFPEEYEIEDSKYSRRRVVVINGVKFFAVEEWKEALNNIVKE